MESSRSNVEEEKRKQAYIRRQISELQAQLKVVPDDSSNSIPSRRSSPKRKRENEGLLIPATPSPKKRRKFPSAERVDNPSASPMRAGRPLLKKNSRKSDTALGDNGKAIKEFKKPPPSNLLKNLAANRHQDKEIVPINRSSKFSDKPPTPTRPTSKENNDVFGTIAATNRDERLLLVEELEPGPVDYPPPPDDPSFKRLEPNSAIHLSSRSVSHEDLQEHLRGRFFISPSRLYSVVRLLPDKQAYDVPVAGDWITIAVVAERGPIKFTRAPLTISQLDIDEKVKDVKPKADKYKNKEYTKPTGKKFMNVKLVDFGAPAKSASSATGGKAVIRGDAILSLLLFESDRFELVTNEGESRQKKVYRGGSGGAFESLERIKEGDVIAVMNPKILKPFQRSNSKNPHPTNNILAITPESAESIMTIGRARDLGMCLAMKKGDKVCGSWYDKRVSDVCDYHVQYSVQRRRAGRAEFSAGTTGMSTTPAQKRKPAYDPANKWGLKPVDSTAGTNYVVSGHIVDSKYDSVFTTENVGREGQAKARRKLSGKDADKALMNLLGRDKEGMKAVMRAREVGQHGITGGKDEKEGKKKLGKEPGAKDAEEMSGRTAVPTKAGYSAEVIKNIGFNPTVKIGHERQRNDLETQKKLLALEMVQSCRKNILLNPRPGPRIRSGVKAPAYSDVSLKEQPKLPSCSDGSDVEIPADPLEELDLNLGARMVDLDEED